MIDDTTGGVPAANLGATAPTSDAGTTTDTVGAVPGDIVDPTVQASAATAPNDTVDTGDAVDTGTMIDPGTTATDAPSSITPTQSTTAADDPGGYATVGGTVGYRLNTASTTPTAAATTTPADSSTPVSQDASTSATTPTDAATQITPDASPADETISSTSGSDANAAGAVTSGDASPADATTVAPDAVSAPTPDPTTVATTTTTEVSTEAPPISMPSADPTAPAVTVSSTTDAAPSTDASSAVADSAVTPTVWTISVAPQAAAAPHVIGLTIAGGDLVATVDGVATSRPLSSVASVTVDGTDGNDALDLGGLGAPLDVPVVFNGGPGFDTVRGPPADSTWTITGPGAGSVGALTFADVENLTGAANNEDTFVLEPGGSVEGTIDGGDGGFDTLVVNGVSGGFVSTPTGPSSGDLAVDGGSIHYAGLEPILMNGGTATDVVFNLTGVSDIATLTQSGSTLTLSGGTFESTVFSVPSGSLTINGGGGNDSVTLNGAINLGGAALTINAESITLASGGSLTTTGAVTFNALAVNPDASTPAALTAAVAVNGDLTAGATQLTAETRQTLAVVQSARFGDDGATNTNSTFTSATGNFTSADIGHELTVVRHLSGIDLIDTATYLIIGINSSTQVVLDSAPPDSSSGLTWRLDRDFTWTLSSSATADIAPGVTVSVDTLLMSARTTISATYSVDDPGDAIYSGVDYPSDAVVHVSVANTTHATIGAGADVTVSGNPVSGDSLALDAIDDTNVGVHVTDVSTPTGLVALGTAIVDFLTFGRLTASTAVSRDTKAKVVGPSTSVSTPGSARVKAENTGAVTSQVDSQFVGVASNSVSKDDAVASIGSGTFGAAALAVSARTATDYAAIAKDVTNSVTGDTKALVGANVITAAAGGVTVEARDDSTLTATATQQTQVPDSPFVTITDARARNDVIRNVEASLTSATVTDAGDLAVLATSNPTIEATMASVSIRTKSEEFGNNYNPNKSAKAIAATMAVNVIRGGVDAHISGGTIDAGNITIQARTDQALIDATVEVAAIAKTAEDAISFPTITGNNALSIGASLALNFIGWNLGTGVAQTALAGVDALLGTDFGATETPWLVQAYGRNAVLNATGDLLVSADSAPLINSTVDNTAKSNNVGIFGVKSSAAASILATNKLSSGSKAFIDYTGPRPAPSRPTATSPSRRPTTPVSTRTRRSSHRRSRRTTAVSASSTSTRTTGSKSSTTRTTPTRPPRPSPSATRCGSPPASQRRSTPPTCSARRT